MRTIAGPTGGGSIRTVPIYRAILPNHPHDARGALTYLRGGRGAYGYLCHVMIECELFGEVVKNLAVIILVCPSLSRAMNSRRVGRHFMEAPQAVIRSARR